MMKVIMFGMGSMGNRHAMSLLNKYDHELAAFRSRKHAKKNSLGIWEMFSWEEVEKMRPDIAFISNPTFLHVETAARCAKLGIRLFIEKPVGCSMEGLDKLLEVIENKELTTYVAYNLRFHPVIKYLWENLKNTRIYHVNVCYSSYFPEWRPHQDYLRSYTAFREKSGGIALELSHEFDYIQYLFGNIRGIKGITRKADDVTVDAEDFVDAVIETEQAVVNLHMNIFSRVKERSIKIDCEKGFFYCDLHKSLIEHVDQNGKNVITFDTGIAETYGEQISYFFENVDNPKMMNNLSEASDLFKKILRFKGEVR